MTDVPSQYKAMVDKYTHDIMDAAREIMALAEELGSDNYECTDDVYVVRIARKDFYTREEAYGGDSPTKD